MHLQVLPKGLYIETEHTGPGPSELDVTKKESSGFTERVESMLAYSGPHDGVRQPQGCGPYRSGLIMKSKDPVNGLTTRWARYRPCEDRSGTIAHKANEGDSKVCEDLKVFNYETFHSRPELDQWTLAGLKGGGEGGGGGQ